MKKFLLVFFFIGIIYGQTDTTFNQEATRFDGKKTSVKNVVEFDGVPADSVFGNNVYVLNLFYLSNKLDSLITKLNTLNNKDFASETTLDLISTIAKQNEIIDSLNKSNNELRGINNKISESNNQLTQANTKLSETNSKLTTLNTELIAVNTNLDETNNELIEINNNTNPLISIGHTTKTITTTASQFSNVSVKKVMIINDSAQSVYLGSSGVTNSSYGLLLNPGMSSGWIELDNLNKVYGITNFGSAVLKILYQN